MPPPSPILLHTALKRILAEFSQVFSFSVSAEELSRRRRRLGFVWSRKIRKFMAFSGVSLRPAAPWRAAWPRPPSQAGSSKKAPKVKAAHSPPFMGPSLSLPISAPSLPPNPLQVQDRVLGERKLKRRASTPGGHRAHRLAHYSYSK